MLEVWIEWLSSLPLWQLYSAFFLIAYIENLFPPIPGDVLLAFGGYLCVNGTMDFWSLFLGSTFISSFGFMTMYYVGVKWHQVDKTKLPWRFFALLLKPELEDTVRRGMRKWGVGIIIMNRFLAGTRTVISLVTGIAEMKVAVVFVAATTSALLWNGLILYAGYIVGDRWEIIGDYLADYAKWIIILLALGFMVKYITSLYKKSRK